MLAQQFKTVNAKGVFSVTQWNTLADSLAHDFPKCDEAHLKWEHRKALHKEHLLGNAFADIICLEEVDHPEDFEEYLKETHQIFFHKKPDGEDGQLVAIKKDKFEVKEKHAVQYVIEEGKKVANQSFWHFIIEEKQVNKHLNLFVTHLKAKKQFENVREEQIKFFFNYLHGLQNHEIAKNAAIVFAGDFNAEPTYQCVINVLSSGILKNAYESLPLDFSTFKVRDKNDVQCRIIDYIFYSHSHLEVISNKSLPTRQQIGENGLPNQHFSSDHLSLTSTFKFL